MKLDEVDDVDEKPIKGILKVQDSFGRGSKKVKGI